MLISRAVRFLVPAPSRVSPILENLDGYNRALGEPTFGEGGGFIGGKAGVGLRPLAKAPLSGMQP